MKQDTKNKFAEILAAQMSKVSSVTTLSVPKQAEKAQPEKLVKMQSFTILWQEGSGKYDGKVFTTWFMAHKAMTDIYNELSGLGYLKVKVTVKWESGQEITDRCDCSDNGGDFSPKRNTIGEYLKKQNSVMYASNLQQGDRENLSFEDEDKITGYIEQIKLEEPQVEALTDEDKKMVLEMSNTTIADILGETKPNVLPDFKLVDYSEKAFAVVITNYEQLSKEDAKLVIEKLQPYGKYNAYLKCGKGWIFSKRRNEEVRKSLNLI